MTALLYVDLETTGLEPQHNSIIEAAYILDVDGQIRTRSAFFVSDLDEPLWQEAALLMHQRTGLLGEWREARRQKNTLTTKQAESLILGSMRPVIKAGSAKLAGNSVHFDRGFIHRYMPELDGFLHYQHVDVSCLNNVFAEFNPRWARDPTAPKPHRALQDADWSRQRYEELTAELKRLNLADVVVPANPDTSSSNPRTSSTGPFGTITVYSL